MNFLYEQTIDLGADAIYFFDSDAFPVCRLDFVQTLLESQPLVAVQRTELNTYYPHPSFIAIRPSFWAERPDKWFDFAFKRASSMPRIRGKVDTCYALGQYLSFHKITWYPLTRSYMLLNQNACDSLLAIYGYLIFHFAAGSRRRRKRHKEQWQIFRMLEKMHSTPQACVVELFRICNALPPRWRMDRNEAVDITIPKEPTPPARNTKNTYERRLRRLKRKRSKERKREKKKRRIDVFNN
jgi:hypothetical protein